MMQDDQYYFRHRAEVEVGRAQKATLPSVVRAHYELAEAYWDKLAALSRQSCETQ